jgi:hypothetical protein
VIIVIIATRRDATEENAEPPTIRPIIKWIEWIDIQEQWSDDIRRIPEGIHAITACPCIHRDRQDLVNDSLCPLKLHCPLLRIRRIDMVKPSVLSALLI